ncbi:MAG: glycosyltransferase family 25 protein, partial [Janthinobacterium lividum]
MLYRLINLDRHPERLAAFQAVHPHLTIERHRGVDGDAVDRARLIENNVISPDLDYTNEALGRTLSHLVQWRDAIKADSAMTVVEDTAVLAPNFVDEVERVIAALPAEWEFVAWGHDSASVLFEVSPGVLSRIQADFSTSNAEFMAGFSERLATTKAFRLQAGTGAMAYSISLRGAWRLQDAFMPIRPMSVRDVVRDQVMVNDGIDVMFARAWPLISAWVSFPPIAATRLGEVATTPPGGVPGVTSSRSVISYDLFDTLVARRCVTPQAIFHIMAAKLKLPDFPAARIEAERRLMHGEFNLEDIYRNLATMLDLTAEETAAMMDLEIATELDNMIPIQQVVSHVRPQDIVVSDMYHSQGILLRILREKLGLVHNKVFVSCHGKKNGTVWPALLDRYRIDLHVGDNPITDHQSPSVFGIPAQITDLSPPSTFERVVDGAGMPELARAMREARLTSRFENAAEQTLREAQNQANLPFLFMLGLDLIEQVRVHGYERILLSGRDCHKLSLLLP